MSLDPQSLVDQFESAPSLPSGSNERFNGYGVMGLPFKSGHVLALRRFPASSVGHGYTSVWHRNPDGDWVFYADVPPRQACARFFGAIAAEAIETEIAITWTAPFRLQIAMPAVQFEWEVDVRSTLPTRFMNAAGRLLPDFAWRNPAVLAAMSALAGPLLGVGRVGLRGSVPNGQRFIANPRTLWAVSDSRAVLAGRDLGPPGPVQPQAHLGDFWIPQRGMVAIGQAYFEPFDAARHSPYTSVPKMADPGAVRLSGSETEAQAQPPSGSPHMV
jgi:hypothetical protein